jgi:hypothetical protein
MTARRNGAVRGLDRVPSGETEGLDTREDFLALQRRPASRREDTDEMLIVDWRSQLRPSEQVERKLMSALKNAMLPVSLVQTRRLRSRRPLSEVPQSDEVKDGANA